MKLIRRLAVAVTLGSLALLLTSAPVFDGYRFYRIPERADLGGEEILLPAEIGCGMIFLNTQVNGSAPQWFMLDTGSGVLILDGRDYPRDAFRRSYLSPSYAVMGLLQNWKPTEPLGELSIGDARFERVSAVFLPDDGIFAKLEAFTGREIGGVIGSNVFASLTLTIDYLDASVWASTIPVGPADGDWVLSIEWIESVPGIEVRLGDHTTTAMLDTARTGPPFMGAALAAPRVDRLIPTGSTTNAFGEEYSTRIGVLTEDIRFGRFALERPVVDLAVSGGPWDEEKLNLGESVLKHFVISLDYSNGRAGFRSHAGDDVVPELGYWTTGVTLDHRQDHLFVSHLIPGTPGSTSGLAIGDPIVEIDHEPAKGFCARETSSRPTPAEPPPITYGVRRDGAIVEIAVPQVRLLP
jgi:hypothetical protein